MLSVFPLWMLPLRVCRCRRFRGRAVRVLQPVQDTRIAPAIQILVKAARPDGLQSKRVCLTVTYHRDMLWFDTQALLGYDVQVEDQLESGAHLMHSR